jgi:mannose-6-phosphate isomerase
MDVYPLIFQPIFKPKIWGGRRLESLLHKRLPEGEPIGESWELADLEGHQSVVANGPARGRTLGELVREWGVELIGNATLFAGRFPLLIKFLDATESISIQVHPDTPTALRLGAHIRPKNEAWYVVDAESSAYIYRGVRKGVDANVLSRALEQRSIESVLSRVPARKGHFYYLPGGTIHALGAGVTVAEVQTPSHVTYRLYDWGRIDPSTGRPRELHVEEALQCVCYEAPHISDERREHVGGIWTAVTRLVRCQSFVIERVRMAEGAEHELPTGEFVVWIVLEGCGSIACEGAGDAVRFEVGDTVLVPAGLKNGRVRTHENCMWLEASVPKKWEPS